MENLAQPADLDEFHNTASHQPCEPTDRCVAAGPVVQSKRGLSAHNLRKTLGRREIISNVSFGFDRGECVGLLGPNGAGKTTLFSILCGLDIADAGRIFLDGSDITDLPMYKRGRLGIGYLPQQSSIFTGLTVEQNIATIVEHRVTDHAERADFVRMILAEFDLRHLRRAWPVQLSGGERRRVEIARSLAAAPQFILLDEPFAGVDPIAIGTVRTLIRQCASWGIGVLITDHNVHATLDLVDRAIVIHGGRILAEGMPEEIVKDPGVRRHYLGAGFHW